MICRRCGKTSDFGYELTAGHSFVHFCLDCGITTVAELAQEGIAAYVIPPQLVKIDDYEPLND